MAVALAAGLSGCHEPPWQNQLASVNAAGNDSGDGESRAPRMSSDGTEVVFESDASDLGPTDTNGVTDVYVRDLATGAAELVSVNTAGTDGGDGESSYPQFSPDATKVGFSSRATNLATPATEGGEEDVYVRDLESGTTTLVSVNADGTGGGDGQSGLLSFSPDANRVLFTSEASNLVPEGSGVGYETYERDLTTGVTTRLGGGAAAYSPSGDAVAYFANPNVYLRDSSTGTITLLSEGPSGSMLTGAPAFSGDGTKVAFQRRTIDDFIRTDIYVHDLVAGTTTLATADVDGRGGSNSSPSTIHGFHPTDANRLLFSSSASNLVANDTDARQDLFVRDLARGVTTRVVRSVGLGSNETSDFASWLGDGDRIAFVSLSGDYGLEDTNRATDVYVLDVAAGSYTLVSAHASGHDGGNGDSGQFELYPVDIDHTVFELSASADGSRIAYGSDANDLGPTDSDRERDHDVYVASLVP